MSNSKRNTYIEKYPIFNGDRYLDVTDSTIVQNKSKGRVLVENLYLDVLDNGDSSNSITIFANNPQLVKVTYFNITSDGNILFYLNLNGTGFVPDLYFITTNNPITVKTRYDVEWCIDGVDNCIKVNGVKQPVSFVNGSATSNFFSLPTLTQFQISNDDKYGRMFKGTFSKLTVYDTDLITELYSVTTNGEVIDASATTEFKRNLALELNYNDSNIDTGDDSLIITANGSENYDVGRYGETSKSRLFVDDTQDDAISDITETITKYSISSFFKQNSTALTNHLSYIAGDNNITGNKIPAIGQVSLIIVGTSIFVIWAQDAAFAYGGSIPNIIDLDKWYYLDVLFDADNSEIKIFLNCQRIDQFLIEPTTIYSLDYSKIQAYQGQGRYIGTNLNGITNADINVYFRKDRKYLISDEEIKSEYKKYPKKVVI